MIGDILQPTHLLFVLVIALLVLGPKRLPEVGRALGRGLRDFRNALNTDELREQVASSTNLQDSTPITQKPTQPTETLAQSQSQDPSSAPNQAAATPPDETPVEVGNAGPSAEPASAAPTPERIP